LHLAFDELFDVNGSVDLMSCEAVLEDLKVLQVCILRVDVELHPGHWHIEVDTVEDLAEGRTSTALFDLGDVQLKEVVEPCDELLS